MPDLDMFVIRHGQTSYNRENRLQGARDIGLNELGVQQATLNGKSLAAIPGFDASRFDWVSSPLSRARNTMELVRQNAGLDPKAYRIEPLLIEVSFGDWEGYTPDEIEAAKPGTMAEREENKWNFLPPGDRAESYEMMAKRVDAYLATVATPTVCVAHGGIIRALFNRIGGLPGDEASMMDVPQDRILRISGTKINWM
ncbi:histidine phosphatase family protein [Hoeflea sp. YIM 152468]|uniref:histidine phosphatase family protein n=1 Tax=Hoeflea sp. YIM 152468 TaxID=3031759 RepID=UPI0023DA5081|nr:histidine phosphatase family protein [Hoeflea sp. YIM 152468]MDF1608586.1 histidine phosphatase family protein [Hoeflea sp. YIM 152468]